MGLGKGEAPDFFRPVERMSLARGRMRLFTESAHNRMKESSRLLGSFRACASTFRRRYKFL